MSPREQQTPGRELSLNPPGQLPTVVGDLSGNTNQVVDGRLDTSMASQVPGSVPSGSLEPPTYQTQAPTAQLGSMPQVQMPPTPSSISVPVEQPPEAREPLRHRLEDPYRPSNRPQQATEYNPGYWRA